MPPTVSLSLNLPLMGAGPQASGNIYESPSIQLQNIGVQIRATVVDANGVAIDISGATQLIFNFLFPDLETTLSVDADFLTDGTDGIIVYDTSGVDLTQDGLYQIQAYVVIPSDAFYTLFRNFWGYPNVLTGTPPPPVDNSSSALIFHDSDSVRWAMTVTTMGAVVFNVRATGPLNYLQLNAVIFKDSDGVYWTVTMNTDGTYTSIPGGTFPQALDYVLLQDSNGKSWIVTISTAGVIGAA